MDVFFFFFFFNIYIICIKELVLPSIPQQLPSLPLLYLCIISATYKNKIEETFSIAGVPV